MWRVSLVIGLGVGLFFGLLSELGGNAGSSMGFIGAAVFGLISWLFALHVIAFNSGVVVDEVLVRMTPK
jgi:hypothetical protein